MKIRGCNGVSVKMFCSGDVSVQLSCGSEDTGAGPLGKWTLCGNGVKVYSVYAMPVSDSGIRHRIISIIMIAAWDDRENGTVL